MPRGHGSPLHGLQHALPACRHPHARSVPLLQRRAPVPPRAMRCVPYAPPRSRHAVLGRQAPLPCLRPGRDAAMPWIQRQCERHRRNRMAGIACTMGRTRQVPRGSAEGEGEGDETAAVAAAGNREALVILRFGAVDPSMWHQLDVFVTAIAVTGTVAAIGMLVLAIVAVRGLRR